MGEPTCRGTLRSVPRRVNRDLALEYVHPDDLELVLRSFETVQEKQIGNPLEIRVRLRDQWRLIELIRRTRHLVRRWSNRLLFFVT